MSEEKIDRSGWPAGPWDAEPDRLEFEALGLPALIIRQEMGHLCGYVAVPPGHPAHGKSYDDLPGLEAHGGLTYAEACQGRICHVPKPGEPDDVWWLGFDCAHSSDVSPSRLKDSFYRQLWSTFSTGERYRDIDYVKAECDDLARQLREMEKPKVPYVKPTVASTKVFLPMLAATSSRPTTGGRRPPPFR